MRVFLAGATGVIGSRLVPQLVGAGHIVAGMTRSIEKVDAVAAQGAIPILVDVYDLATLRSEMLRFAPDVVMHQLTDLPDDRAKLAAFSEANARIRIEGTRKLLAAAGSAGRPRFLAQSVAWQLPAGPPADGVAELERAVLEYGGVVLRYGQLYGPDTYYPGDPPRPPRVHIAAVAQATLAALALDRDVLTIVDD